MQCQKPFRSDREKRTASDPFLGAGNIRQNHQRSLKFNHREQQICSITAIILLVLPLAGLIIWLPYISKSEKGVGLESIAIGGRLTQVQAKAIDFICGAVLAPLIVASFNYFWFSNLRVNAINECLPKRSISFKALAEASSTDTGSFNLVKLWTFLGTGTWSLTLFAVAVLLSAGTKSLLSNIIAYEAYTTQAGIVSQSLQFLYDPLLHTFGDSPSWMGYLYYNFSTDQQARFTNDFNMMLMGLGFHAAKTKLDGKYYIGINATQASLDALPSSISNIADVPGYRLSTACQPLVAQSAFVVESYIIVGVYTEITYDFGQDVTINATKGAIGSKYAGSLMPFTSLSRGETLSTLAFDRSQENGFAYVLWLSSEPMLNLGANGSAPLDTVYGPMYSKKTNVTLNGRGTNGTRTTTTNTMYSWGLNCTISRQNGRHNLTRRLNSTWTRSASIYSQQNEPPRFFNLKYWELQTSFQRPWSLIPGLGPAITSTAGDGTNHTSCQTASIDTTRGSLCGCPTDFETAALNALYAIGEAERITAEVAMWPVPGNNTYAVKATANTILYRMTYVPLILLLALFSAILASAVPLGFLVFNWHHNSKSLNMWRDVDVVRLVADSLEGLRSDENVPNLHRMNNAALAGWAADCKVRYRRIVDDDGVSISLDRKNMNNKECGI
jgi:hypothetical protein